MSDNTTVGGYGTDVFRIHDTGSAYAPKKLDGTTAAASATDRMLRLILQTNLTFTPNEDGTGSVKFDQDKDDNELIGMLEAVVHTPISSSTAGKVSERVYRNATKRFGDAPTSVELCLVIDYGVADLDDTTLLKLFAAIGYFKRTSGTFKSEAASTSAPQLEFTQVVTKYDYDCITLVDGATGMIDKTATTAFVIPEAVGFKQKHVLIKT